MLLPPFQIISRFGFSRYIDHAMHLDIYIMSRYMAKTMYLEKPKRLIISNGGSRCQGIEHRYKGPGIYSARFYPIKSYTAKCEVLE
jgi:hypothetical protein